MAPVLVSPPLLVRSLLCTRDRKHDSRRPSKQNGMKKPSCRWTLSQIQVPSECWRETVSCPLGSASFEWLRS